MDQAKCVDHVRREHARDDRHVYPLYDHVLYEDKNGNIYISADKKGIFRLSFKDFR